MKRTPLRRKTIDAEVESAAALGQSGDMKTNKNSQKREVGRPELPPEERRVHRVFVSYTDAEYEEIKLKAARYGLPVAAWIRSTSLSQG